MSIILLVLTSLIFISCTSLKHEANPNYEIKSPGYQYGKHWDEKTLKSGIIDR